MYRTSHCGAVAKSSGDQKCVVLEFASLVPRRINRCDNREDVVHVKFQRRAVLPSPGGTVNKVKSSSRGPI